MTIINPSVGSVINWLTALSGDPARSSKFGAPMVRLFNHLRQFRAGEYVASYSGRANVDINGDDANRFHIISRFPVQTGGGDVTLIITQKNWQRGYGVIDEKIEWFKDYTDVAADVTLYENDAVDNAVTNDNANDLASGRYCEWQVDVEPTAADDGFRCSRLNIDNAMVHRLNVFGCPIGPDLDTDEAIVGLSDVSVNRVLRGWDQGNNDGTLGAVAHYIDAGDSCIHNTSRALFNTCYALGVYQTGAAAHAALRQDSDGDAMTYKVKARNLTGAASDIPCDLAIMAWGGENSEVAFTSANANAGGGDKATFVMPAGIAIPTLFTTSDFDGKLDIHKDGDYVTVTGKSAGGLELHVQTVSLWEPYQHR